MKALAMTVVLAGLVGAFQNCAGNGFGASEAQGVADSITAENRVAGSGAETVYYEYHYKAGGQGDFIYRTNDNANVLLNQGYVLDGRSFSVLSAASADPVTLVLKECFTDDGFRFISNAPACEGYRVGQIMGYAYQTQQPNTTRLLRLVNPSTGAHWEVRADRLPAAGYANLGFSLEGSLGWIPTM